MPGGAALGDNAGPAIALDGPEPPADGIHVWAWFLDLHQGRGGNGFGANPISWSDIRAWRELMGVVIRPAEIEAIMALDRAWFAAQTKDPAPAPAARQPFPKPRSARSS